MYNESSLHEIFGKNRQAYVGWINKEISVQNMSEWKDSISELSIGTEFNHIATITIEQIFD